MILIEMSGTLAAFFSIYNAVTVPADWIIHNIWGQPCGLQGISLKKQGQWGMALVAHLFFHEPLTWTSQECGGRVL